jgi:hypothetical protein
MVRPVRERVHKGRNESVMIDGRWTMFHRKLLTIDEKIVLREAKDRAAKIAAQSGLNLSQRFNWV